MTTADHLVNELAALVRARRRELGITQAELARRMGTAQMQVSRLENANTVATLTTLDRLAHALDITFSLVVEERILGSTADKEIFSHRAR